MILNLRNVYIKNIIQFCVSLNQKQNRLIDYLYLIIQNGFSFIFRFTDDDVDEMYREAPIKGSMFDYLEFTRILKHGAKDKDEQ